eukprot:TRINITY_DN3085_c0_g1_i1.p1 TRINITY_DN3085_c0_g1~~TRINITY_DN3085_c0_g1_i1.p1  ORF type:complete len:205 (-),score=64.74 TRINITY_DN3085_c0_g1_i1:131-745(-)
MLLKWYHNDFGKTDSEVIDWMTKYSSNKVFLNLVKSVDSKNIKISYSKYNWDQNNRGYEENNGAVVVADELSSSSLDLSLDSSSNNDSAYSSDVLTLNDDKIDKIHNRILGHMDYYSDHDQDTSEFSDNEDDEFGFSDFKFNKYKTSNVHTIKTKKYISGGSNLRIPSFDNNNNEDKLYSRNNSNESDYSEDNSDNSEDHSEDF